MISVHLIYKTTFTCFKYPENGNSIGGETKDKTEQKGRKERETK
jgi:hypothetical protein